MTELPDKTGRRKSGELLTGRSAYGPKLPPILARIFGAPPLIGGEDPRLYEELFSLFVAKYDPQDVQDWLLVKDKTDLSWERLRERRLKAVVIKIYHDEPREQSNSPYAVEFDMSQL